MRLFCLVLFWACLAILFYTYIGYPILLYLLVRLKRVFVSSRPVPESAEVFMPEITFIVAAYNEEKVIEKKIQNCFSLIYPSDKLKFIFVTDGSRDKTTELVSAYPGIKLLHQEERKGKVSALNRAMKEVNSPIVIFSDANSFINPDAPGLIVRHYQDERVGGVAGEKKVLDPKRETGVVLEEGAYWKYESFLKKLDSSFYTVVGAAGELFSMRTKLFEFLSDEIIIEDFVQSLLICQKGYSVRYEPGAIAIETSSGSLKEEQARKIRISTGGFQAMVKLKSLFNVFRYPAASFQFLSHRILRWTICPLSLPLLFLANLYLAFDHPYNAYMYTLAFVLQALFYLLGAIGLLLAVNNLRISALTIPYYFIFMNVAVYIGFWAFIRNRQTVLWEKASRRDLA